MGNYRYQNPFSASRKSPFDSTLLLTPFTPWNNDWFGQGCQFSRNKMILQFGLFSIMNKNIFLGPFWINFNKTCNILWYSKIYLIYFGKFSMKICPFLAFENLVNFIFWDLATLVLVPVNVTLIRSHSNNMWHSKVKGSMVNKESHERYF